MSLCVNQDLVVVRVFYQSTQKYFNLFQLGPNIKELFRLIEDFVDVIGLRMKDFQDMYEVTENLGGLSAYHSIYYYYYIIIRLPCFTCFTFYMEGSAIFMFIFIQNMLHVKYPRNTYAQGNTA